MAVTAPASLTKIHAEFGGSGPLSDYIRGGAYVPDIPANSGISTTTAGLNINSFVGASAAVVVTEGSTGSAGNGSWGYSSGNFGSVVGEIAGETVVACFYQEITVKESQTQNFSLTLAGLHAANKFTSVTLVDTAGDPVLTSASAEHSQSGGNTNWLWSVGDYSADWNGSGTQTIEEA